MKAMVRHSNDRAPSDVGVTTLAAGYYTDPAYFAREQEHIFRKHWLFAGRHDDVPPGSYVTRRLGDAQLLLVRDEAGVLRAFHNVCRHRGTLLCSAEHGPARGHLQCAYHAWTYRLDGALHRAPHMEKVSGFRTEDWPLLPVALQVWAGNVFLYLGEGTPPPLSEYLDTVDTRFAAWAMAELRTVARRTYQLRANWKLVISNYHECLHCPVAHPQLCKLSPYLSGDNEPMHPTWMGASMELLPGCATLSLSEPTAGAPRRAPLPGLDEQARRSVFYYALLPSMLLNPHPDYVVTFQLRPLAADRTEIECHWLMHPDEIARPGFDPSDAVEFWDLTNRQDWELSDLAQAGISSRGYRPGPYSNREELLAAFDRWVIERAGAL
ncbi:MAG: aromatic ring-hydroxylating dioxygenase subunit alpha [Myxococcales bacterium]|nr:aromatic ring-hydroxylating dioxygenase subunit alpha [Myxococcales bacterium]